MSSKQYCAVSSVASVALEAEIDDCHQRLLSGEIIMSTAASNTTGPYNKSSREIAVRPFVEAFDAELRRLEGILTNHRNTIDASAEALLKDAAGLSRRKEQRKLSNADLKREAESLRKYAKELQTKTLKTITEVTKNQKEFHRIALKADSKLKTSCVDESERTFSKEPWTDKGSAGHIVKLLSDIFSLIRKIEEDVKEKDEQWVAPSSFERVTTKYWVLEEHLPEVLLKSASELPVLVYGKSGLLTKNIKDPSEFKDDFWKSMASPISSVYFDSDNLDLYQERLKRAEGAQLVRVRWYGNKKPKEDAPVFVELKTHHECWIDNKSVKERVNILQKRMNDLIDLTNGPWSLAFCKLIVVEASDSEATEEEILASAELLVEIRNLFCKWKLKPCVRTSYTRAAFQNPNNNNLRLTIDRDITVVDETRAHRNGKKGTFSWCIEDNDVVPIDAFIKVPYGVFEVKVASGENPSLIEELKDSDAIVEAPKFSKFLTGASLHNVDKVKTLPWWSEDALFAPMFKARSGIPRKSYHAKPRDYYVDASASFHVEDDISSSDSFDGDLTELEEGRPIEKDEVGNSDKTKSFLDFSSRTNFSAIAGMRSRASSIFEKSRQRRSSSHNTAPRSPARVEPKSFFANERTFIQWITVGSLFMFVAGVVYSAAMSAGPHDGKLMMMFGNGLIGCALFVVVYGSFVYYRRLHLMINAKPYGYSDTFGPAILALFMTTLLGTFVYVYFVQFEYPNGQLMELPGTCVERKLDLGPTSGISALQFEPSALAIDEERDLLIVASLDEIIAIPALPNGESPNIDHLKILHRFPEGSEDLEALEIINGTVYAVSENKKRDQSDIIAFDWTSEGLLNETNRWRLKAPNVEGMAYTEDPNWFQGSYLMVAADLRTLDPALRLDLTGIRMPLPNVDMLKEVRLNNKFFVQRLEDTKIAEMQFFGGLLYALYNNERIIRAFDFAGNMVNEWKLPVGVTLYDQYWEGMRLQQDGDDMYLHLALDSPPKVWTIKLEGETSNNSPSGQWKLPRCAGG